MSGRSQGPTRSGASERGAEATEVVITPYRDGPLLVRGNARIEDQDGNRIEPGRDVVALCRCGKSRIRPFCDGSHKLTGFRAPSSREQRGRATD